MQKINKKILLTRIVSDDLIRRASDNGIYLSCVPFISIEYLENEELKREISSLSGKECHVILTSAHAVHALSNILGDIIPDWKLYCIGPVTSAAAAELFGKNSIVLMDSYASNLGEEIIKQFKERSFLFFCGDKRMDTLPEMLQQAGINLKEITVYKNIASPQTIDEYFDAIGFFSPSAVESFFKKNTAYQANEYFSIGRTTTAALKEYTDSLIIESTGTSQDKMIETIISHYYNSKIDTTT